MKKHKTLGQVFTPKWIVREILDLVGYQGEEILHQYILEPACGDGAFLLEIVKRYIQGSKTLNLDKLTIKKNLETYICGIELDEMEYNQCIQNLNALAKEKLNIDHIEWKIFNTNTLYIFEKYPKFFDYIVGNPPYIRIHNLDLETRHFLKDKFMFSEGTIDIYLSFFEMAIQMIKPKGMIGYITPNSYLHNSSYAKFRTYLRQQKIVHTLIDFKANKIFKGFSTYTAITILENNDARDTFIYKELKEDKIKEVNHISYATLEDKDWSFTDVKNEQFLQKLHDNKNAVVRDLFNVQYGFATLRDKIFIGTIQPDEVGEGLVLFNGFPIEQGILKDVVKGSKYKGEINKTDKIIFPYEKIKDKYRVIPEEKMHTHFPNCYAYFLKNKEDLTSRNLDKGALWYEYGRSQGIQTMHQEKIILSTLVNEGIHFYKVPSDTLMYSGIFITKKNPKVDWCIIEEVLQSKAFFQFIRITGKDFSGGYKSISTKQIKAYRINIVDEAKLLDKVSNT